MSGTAPCIACGQPIAFRQLPSGKYQPVDRDGTVHFASCPARRAAKPALPRDICVSCGSVDVQALPGAGQHWGAIKCRDCGAHRWLTAP